MKKIKLLLTLNDATTLAGLLDGCRGTSDNDNFSAFATRTLKKLDKDIKAKYGKQEMTTSTAKKKIVYI